MKICIVLRDITESGGGERVCVNLANALSAEHQVKIVSFYKSKKTSAYFLNPSVKVEYLHNGSEQSGGKLAYLFKKIFFRYFLTLKARKRFFNDDIIIANDRALGQFLKIKGKSYIRIWHLIFPKRKRDLKFFDELVILSHKEEQKWRAIHPNVSVIPNFLPSIPQAKTDYSQKVCLSVGKADSKDTKGFLRLIDIFTQIDSKFREWKLCIVGDGVLGGEVEAKVKSLDFADRIILKPFTQEIEKEYLRSSIYAMTSYFEGFGMVLVESGSYGLPGVAFDICAGPGDIIEEGKSGFLIQDGDLQDYALKLQVLMESEERRREMGEEAKKRIATHFSQEEVLKQWNELFNRLQTHNPQLPQ